MNLIWNEPSLESAQKVVSFLKKNDIVADIASPDNTSPTYFSSPMKGKVSQISLALPNHYGIVVEEKAKRRASKMVENEFGRNKTLHSEDFDVEAFYASLG